MPKDYGNTTIEYNKLPILLTKTQTTMKKLLTLLTLLVLFVTGAWADGTINAASTTDLGNESTPRYVVEQTGVGRLMKNKTGSSSWSVSSGYLGTSSNMFALQTYNDISEIVITGYGTGSNRTLSKVEVGTTTSNYAEVTASSLDTMNGSSAGTSQTMTITPSSTIAANSYIAITLTGNINISSVTLVYAAQTAPDAPTFSPNGGSVEGLSTANIVSEGKTTYYQWSTNASASLTTASDGWSTGTSAEVPNTDGTYYLYAYASNGDALNSSVVRSDAFSVTSVSVTAATITWEFDNNTAPAAAVLSAGSELISGSTITMGSNLAFEKNTDHCYVDSEGEDNVTVSRVKPSSVESSNDLLFSIDLKDGVTFQPTSVSFVAMKQGTNGAVTLDAKWYEDGESDISLLTNQALKRASSSGTYATPGGDRFAIDPAAKGVVASAATTGLRLVLNNTNSYGIGEIIITGRFIGTPVVPTETYTVTFDAGSNGTCATASLTEDEPGAGVTLPAVTPNSGYGFLGWYTAADEGSKVGDAGDTYNPTEDITLYAQYSEEVAPTISIDNYTPSTSKGTAITLTATPTGSPTPTVKWYQSATATNTGGTEKATGLTYKPDVTAEGTFYYYAVASNGVSPDATSNLITLTVTDPNKYATNNAYYMSVGETPVPDEQIIGDDITMTFVNGKAGESFTAGVTDLSVNGVNKNFVASISGSNSNNGWKARFVPTTDGVLSVGVVINKDKTFSISNATEFRYQGKNGANEDVDETNNSSSLTTADNDNAKLYVVVTISVENGKTYDFSVASSKMGFYGFEFHKAETKNLNADGYSTFSSNYDVEVSGAKAYTAKLDLVNNTITCTEIADSKVPAGAGVLLFKEANAEVTFTPTYGVAALSNNDLKGSTKADGSLATEETGHTYYVLNGDTFKEYTATTFVAGKAYFDVEGGAVQGKLTIVFDDDMTTTIDNLTISQSDKNAQMYNLSGQKVNESYKGIVIVSGKKYINK